MKRAVCFLLAAAALAWLLGCDGAESTSRYEDTGPDTAADRANSAGDATSPTQSNGFDDFSLTVERLGDVTVCQVTFNRLPPTADIAAKVVRNAAEELVRKNSNREILVMAFNASGEALPDTQYGGALVYKPSDGQILTTGARSGLQSTETDEGSYFVQVEDGRTVKGITPVRRWYDASIVFPDESLAEEVRAVALKEIGKLKSRGRDVHLYIYRGDKSNKISWEQIKAPNGNFMAVDYVAATGEVSPNWDWGPSTAPADEPKYESRTWTDATGRYSVEAVLVSYADGQVTIKRDDNGKVIIMPLDRLSENCKQYVRSL